MISFTLEENLHNYKKHIDMDFKRIGLLMLWLLYVLAIFSFFILDSPNPFSVTSKQYLSDKTLLFKPNKDYKCDLFMGRWIPDLKGWRYSNWSCPMIPDSNDCGKHGRENLNFVNWRWKPEECELPRFEAKAFLRIVQGKTLAFIGDSVARNQVESLLCLLSQDKIPTEIYKEPRVQLRTWYFPSHNFTIMFFWSKFLVTGEERVINGWFTGAFDLQLDKIDDEWAKKLPEVDYAVISDAHWFFRKNYLYEGGNLIGCLYCNQANITDISVGFALRRVFQTVLEYINSCEECRGLLTLLRTFSPSHFEHGTWKTGGNCNRTNPYSEGEVNFGGIEWEVRSIQVEEIEKAKKKGVKRGIRFEAIDITKAMLMRPDGHPDSHWNDLGIEGINDCVHWCLPGPIDAWNDLLMAVLSKEEGSSLH